MFFKVSLLRSRLFTVYLFIAIYRTVIISWLGLCPSAIARLRYTARSFCYCVIAKIRYIIELLLLFEELLIDSYDVISHHFLLGFRSISAFLLPNNLVLQRLHFVGKVSHLLFVIFGSRLYSNFILYQLSFSVPLRCYIFIQLILSFGTNSN